MRNWGISVWVAVLVLTGCGPADMAEVNVRLEREDHLFLSEGPVTMVWEIRNPGNTSLSGQMDFRVKSDFGEEAGRWSERIDIGPEGTAEVPADLGELAPGFYQVSAVFTSKMDTALHEIVIGVRPEDIVSPPDRPDDFREYWDRARKELAGVDPQYRLIRQEAHCTDTREVFLLEMRSLGNVLIRGWYMRPVEKGTYPAILHVQGYSSVKGPDDLYQGDDMVSLALNIRGHGNSRDDLDPGFPGYLLHGVDDEDQYIYRGAYMDCLRGLDFLFSREEVDTSRVAVEGGSQGGALSFATAALAPDRIALCVPHVPFLSDFRDYFRIADWPAGEFFEWFAAHPEIPEARIYRTLSYIDIKNLAPWIKAPVFMAVGLKDHICPPHINFAAYNQLKVPKEYLVYPEAGHSLPGEYYQEMIRYIRNYFAAG